MGLIRNRKLRLNMWKNYFLMCRAIVDFLTAESPGTPLKRFNLS